MIFSTALPPILNGTIAEETACGSPARDAAVRSRWTARALVADRHPNRRVKVPKMPLPRARTNAVMTNIQVSPSGERPSARARIAAKPSTPTAVAAGPSPVLRRGRPEEAPGYRTRVVFEGARIYPLAAGPALWKKTPDSDRAVAGRRPLVRSRATAVNGSFETPAGPAAAATD